MAEYWVQADYEWVVNSNPDDDGLVRVTFMGEPIPDTLGTPYQYVEEDIPWAHVTHGEWTDEGFVRTGIDYIHLTADLGPYHLANEFTPDQRVGPDIEYSDVDDFNRREVSVEWPDYVWVRMDVGNEPPLAQNDHLSFVKSGETFHGAVLGNDEDPDGDHLSASLVSDPSHGSVSLRADGTFDYIPEGGFIGDDDLATADDSFTYEVSDGQGGKDQAEVYLYYQVENRPPDAWDDVVDGIRPGENNPGVSVLYNDDDPDGDTLTASLKLAPTNGSVKLNPDGTFTYTSDAGYFGDNDASSYDDVFTYEASDGRGGTDTATVYLHYTPCEDLYKETVVSYLTNLNEYKEDFVNLKWADKIIDLAEDGSDGVRGVDWLQVGAAAARQLIQVVPGGSFVKTVADAYASDASAGELIGDLAGDFFSVTAERTEAMHPPGKYVPLAFAMEQLVEDVQVYFEITDRQEYFEQIAADAAQAKEDAAESIEDTYAELQQQYELITQIDAACGEVA